jgi:hypothetical protein
MDDNGRTVGPVTQFCLMERLPPGEAPAGIFGWDLCRALHMGVTEDGEITADPAEFMA